MFKTLIHIVIVVMLMSAAVTARAQKRSTLHGSKATKSLRQVESLVADSVSVASIVLSGYDKTVSSNKETLFITNNSELYVTGITLDILYLDLQGRELHRRTVSRRVDLPAGDTRCVDFPSWDAQKSFYYRYSKTPRKQAIPYDVRISTISVDSAAEKE